MVSLNGLYGSSAIGKSYRDPRGDPKSQPKHAVWTTRHQDTNPPAIPISGKLSKTAESSPLTCRQPSDRSRSGIRPLIPASPLTCAPYSCPSKYLRICMGSPYSGGMCVHSAIFSSIPAMMGSSPRLRPKVWNAQAAEQRSWLDVIAYKVTHPNAPPKDVLILSVLAAPVSASTTNDRVT